MLAESVNRAMEGHRYRLTAFVFMPEHVHLMVYPLPEADTIDALLKAVERPLSYRIIGLRIHCDPQADQRKPGIRRATQIRRVATSTVWFRLTWCKDLCISNFRGFG